MAQKLYEEENIRAIAVKIREKTGGTKTYTTEQMPDGIEAVHIAGYQQGYNFGYDEGYEDCEAEGGGDGNYADGYNDGKVDTQLAYAPLADQIVALDNFNIDVINVRDYVRFDQSVPNPCYAFKSGIYGINSYSSTVFSELVEYENSALSSNPLTISVANYNTQLYVALYFSIVDNNVGVEYGSAIIVPPNSTTGKDFESSSSQGYDWEYHLLGVKFYVRA